MRFVEACTTPKYSRPIHPNMNQTNPRPCLSKRFIRIPPLSQAIDGDERRQHCRAGQGPPSGAGHPRQPREDRRGVLEPSGPAGKRRLSSAYRCFHPFRRDSIVNTCTPWGGFSGVHWRGVLEPLDTSGSGRLANFVQCRVSVGFLKEMSCVPAVFHKFNVVAAEF